MTTNTLAYFAGGINAVEKSSATFTQVEHFTIDQNFSFHQIFSLIFFFCNERVCIYIVTTKADRKQLWKGKINNENKYEIIKIDL